MLCTLALDGLVAGMDGADNKLDVGTDYEVVTVSVDPGETPELAGRKKENYLKMYHREGGSAGWHFLTGEEEAIETLAQSVGFRYYYDSKTDQYAHAAGIMVLTPGGQVSSYYLGIEYKPKMLQYSLMDAAQGNIGPLVDQLLLLCYGYDPAVGTYGFMILQALRIGAGGVVLLILGFWLTHYFKQGVSGGVEGSMAQGASHG